MRDKYTQDEISSAKRYLQTTEKFQGEDTGTFISEGNTYDRCSNLSCFVVLFVPFVLVVFCPVVVRALGLRGELERN